MTIDKNKIIVTGTHLLFQFAFKNDNRINKQKPILKIQR